MKKEGVYRESLSFGVLISVLVRLVIALNFCSTPNPVIQSMSLSWTAVLMLSPPIDLMIADRNFQAAVFILSYRGRGVACIKFTEAGASSFNSTDMTKTTEGDIQISSPLSNLTKVLPQAPKDAATTSANPQNDPRLEIAFQLTGSVVTIYEIFFMALDMLRDIAFSRRTARLADGATLIKAANLIISTRQTDPPRTAQDPPFFQVEWFMRALARTPAYMLDQRNFKEVEMVLFVEEVKVGEVSVRRPGTGSGLLPASDGLSTS